MPSVINTLHTYDTEYSADSIEWCPHNPCQHLFVCGTYQLETGESLTGDSNHTTRKGRILLFGFNAKQNLLLPKQRIETSAILDQKWSPLMATLAVVNASGEVLMYNLSSEDELVQIDTLTIPSEDDNEQLALSIDWAPQGDKVVVSDSKGGISIIGIEEQGMHYQTRWKAHSFEAWTCAFDKTDQNVIYTGGDDTLLCIYDIRCLESPAVKMKNKAHGAGVTALLSFHQTEHLLATGSYDDNLRIFDTRSMKSCISETNLGGGIWRLKPHPFQPEKILCACMYHNFSVVTLNEDQSVTIVAEYYEHGSICYGCDWSYESSNVGASYFASCSFYDHKMCLATLEAEK